MVKAQIRPSRDLRNNYADVFADLKCPKTTEQL